MSFRGMETAFEICSRGLLFRGTVIHGGHMDGYGPLAPEVIFERVIDEDNKTDVDFDAWLAADTRTDRERNRTVAELEDEAIAKVVRPREDDE